MLLWENSLLIDKNESDNKLVIVSRRNLYRMKKWIILAIKIFGFGARLPKINTYSQYIRSSKWERYQYLLNLIVYIHYRWTEVWSLYLTSICLDNCKSSKKTRSLFIKQRTQIPSIFVPISRSLKKIASKDYQSERWLCHYSFFSTDW